MLESADFVGLGMWSPPDPQFSMSNIMCPVVLSFRSAPRSPSWDSYWDIRRHFRALITQVTRVFRETKVLLETSTSNDWPFTPKSWSSCAWNSSEAQIRMFWGPSRCAWSELDHKWGLGALASQAQWSSLGSHAKCGRNWWWTLLVFQFLLEQRSVI